jgi:subtilisin family serine protease
MSAAAPMPWIDEPTPTVRSGEGVRVALIDSGVERDHPWLTQAPIEHRRVEKQGAGHVVALCEGGDGSGHGTACAGIIHRMVPAATIVSVRALGPDGRCSRMALLDALGWCVRERFDVVNMSLGIDVPRRAPLRVGDHRDILALYELADEAYTEGVVLVAAGPNVAHFRTYPGRFKSLVGVGRSAATDWEALETSRTTDHEILAPGTDVLAPALGGGERKWTGTSFAAPFVTAHVARIRAARARLPIEEVKAALHALARRRAPP